MPFFSIFGKKKSPAEPGENQLENAAIDPIPEVDQSSAPVELESPSQISQRDLARRTAEKIDAIESEITRDILKAPTVPAEPMPQAEAPASQTAAAQPQPADDYAPTDLFRSTELRIDKETLLLFQHELDK